MSEQPMGAKPDAKSRLLMAMLEHVPFDGWSDASLEAAAAECGLDLAEARAMCPRGPVDLAVAAHKAGDEAMQAGMADLEMDDLRYSEKVAALVRLRLECAGDKEVVRRATTLFALPHHAAEGAKLIWDTADTVWNALGDTSDDLNWYSKRAILSGVYGSTVLFWLGDTSEEHSATWAFLDRRIANVMQFEKTKSQLQKNPFITRLMAGPGKIIASIKAPNRTPPDDLPGYWDTTTKESKT